MKLSTLLIFIFICNSCFSQTFTGNELIKLYRHNYDDFDTKVSQRGFDFVAATLKQNEKEIAKYALNEPINDGYYTELIKKITYKSGIKALMYQVDSKENYLKLKEQLKNLGFESVKTKTAEDRNMIFYINENQISFKDIFIYISIAVVDNVLNNKQTIYEITIHNNSKIE